MNKGGQSDNTNNSNAMATPAQPGAKVSAALPPQGAAGASLGIDRKRLQDLVKQVDPLEQIEDDVEETLMGFADDFIDNVVVTSCLMAKHRKSNTLEVKDVQLCLERNHGMWVPGFGSDDIRPYRKAPVTEAHKQRMALIRKTLKKS